MTEPNENFRHQHQDLRKEGGVQFGDLPEFCDFDYIAQIARVNAAALGMLALCRILFGGLGLHGSGRSRWRGRMGERWERMTPEERMRFREGLRGRCDLGSSPSGESQGS